MEKLNCWEFMKCGREPGGTRVADLGICPVADLNLKANGVNSGKEGGRICWAICGTLCNGKLQGRFAYRHLTCTTCKFFKLAESEEGESFSLLLPQRVDKQPTD